jgi:hypothetical protein
MNKMNDVLVIKCASRVGIAALIFVSVPLASSVGAEQFTLVVDGKADPVSAAPAEKVDDKQRDTRPPIAPIPAEKNNPAKSDTNEKSKGPPTEKLKKDDAGSTIQAKPQIKAQPAPRPNIVVRNALPGGNNPIGLERQIRARLEPTVKAELSFAIRTAGLNGDERQALIVGGKKWLDDFVVEFSKKQDPNQRQMWLQGLHQIGGRQSGDDPRELVQRGIAGVAAETLPKEKMAAYKTECDKRSAYYREVIVDNLVDLIDAKVILSPAQRQKIAKSLKEHWDPAWAPQLDFFAINSDYWPDLPEECISPDLTAAQRNVLDKSHRITGHMIIGGGGFGFEVGQIDDINLDDAPAKEGATNAD